MDKTGPLERPSEAAKEDTAKIPRVLLNATFSNPLNELFDI